MKAQFQVVSVFDKPWVDCGERFGDWGSVPAVAGRVVMGSCPVSLPDGGADAFMRIVGDDGQQVSRAGCLALMD